jgi:glycine betaine/proline transport system permease protein
MKKNKLHISDIITGVVALSVLIMLQAGYKLPISDAVEGAINFLINNFSIFTRSMSSVIEVGLNASISIFSLLNPLFTLVIFSLLIWKFTDRKIALFSFTGFLLIYNLGYWDATIESLSLVIFATLLSIIFGIPLGILSAINDSFNKIITPVLDFMQTMPAFVYLIPAIPFFGLGKVSAAFATIIFSIPPCIRLTSLGIRQVPKDLIEAADAFGSTRMQKLFKVQLPIAIPTIMAGVNQTIMLSLSMVVIAAMIGAKGLGGVVWKAIQRLQPGLGFEAGLAIVIVAMILDRITKHLTKPKRKKA